jgi:hypothetical protein
MTLPRPLSCAKAKVANGPLGRSNARNERTQSIQIVGRTRCMRNAARISPAHSKAVLKYARHQDRSHPSLTRERAAQRSAR